MAASITTDAPDATGTQDAATATNATDARDIHAALLALVERSGMPFSVLEHAPTRTIEDAQHSLDIDVTRIVKTIAFAARPAHAPATDHDRLVLAALRGTRRVDYAKLAGFLGMNRRDIRPLAPGEVLNRLGVAPGGVSPLLPAATTGSADALVLMDEDALTIAPDAYSGLARPDRTLVMAATDLARLSRARIGAFSKPSE